MIRKLEVLLILAFLGLVFPGAQATSTSHESLPNYSGILIRTGGALEMVPVQADYTINNFSSTKPLSGTYRVGLQLVNPQGIPASTEVFSAPFPVALLPRTAASGTVSANLSSTGIVGGSPYRVSSQLYTTGATPGSWVAIGIADTSGEYRFALVDADENTGLVAWLNGLDLTRAYAVNTAPAANSFQVHAQGVLGRRDLPTTPVTTDADQVFFDVTLRGARTGPIGLAVSRTTLPTPVPSHAANGSAAAFVIDQTLDLRPTAQLDSTDSYTLTVAMSHAGPDGLEKPDRMIVLAAQRLLHFNGTLVFGPLSATITAIGNDPAPEGTLEGVGENTEVSIDDHGAHLNTDPALLLDAGQTIHVLLGVDGTATAQDAATIAAGTGPLGTIAGVTYTLEGVMIDGAGGHATGGTVQFPAGFGVSAAPDIRRLNAEHPFGAGDLNSSLQPVGIILLSPSQLDPPPPRFYAVHEDLPEQFAASSIAWDTAAGTFTIHRVDTRHVRAAETAALNSLPVVIETLIAQNRPSNDGYLALPGPGGGDVVIRADAQGRAILQEATLDLPASKFTAHFPAETTVAWTQPGQLVIKGGTIDLANSSLAGAADVTLITLPGAPNLTLLGGEESFLLHPDGAAWGFTPDGALSAQGIIAAAPLKWGARNATEVAQTAASFTTGSALIPGFVLHGSSAVSSNDSRPGELLLTGHGKPGGPTYVERPSTGPYALGLADYAGFNLRTTGAAGPSGTSLLGDATLGPYPLATTSKYYLRKAGVSGIHAADRSFFSAKGIQLTMDGFALTLTDYQLSYRDNKVVDSLISGSVDVPGVRGKPGFTQPFSKLYFDTQGQPAELALVQNGALEQPLAYWHARFHPISAEFVLKPSDTKQAALIFGAEVLLPGILRDPIRGGLGFLPSGKLASATDGFPGVNSRLKPPKHFTLHGPGSPMNANVQGFTVSPVGDIYFNDPYYKDAKNNLLAPEDGFVAFAAGIRVPFFENLLVHVLARADTGRTAIRAGWQQGQKSFFTDVHFDAGNVGFPPTDSFAAYINENEPGGFTYFIDGDNQHKRNPYNPLVRQSWLGVVDFALPVKWDPVRRRFVSTVPEERPFLILSSQRTLQQLTPSGAEIRFGLQFNNLPRLNLSSLVISDREAADATDDLIKFIPDGPKLAAASSSFEKLLSGDSSQLIADGFDTVLDTLLDSLLGNGGPLNGLTSAGDAAKAIGTPADPGFKDLSAKLKVQLSGAVGALNVANSLFGQVADGLDVVDNALSTADTLLQKDKNGQRGAFINDAIRIATSIGLPAESAKSATDSITREINGELAPTLDQISGSLDDVHSLSKSARKVVDGGRDVTAQALGSIKVAESLPNEILTSLHDYLSQLHDPTGHALSELGPDKLRIALKKAALDAIKGSDFVAQLDETVRDLVEPLHEEYGVIYEQVFGVLNDVVRSALEELSNQVVDHLNDEAGMINRAVGNFRDALELTKVEGSAQILGNVLDNAHLNATLGLSVPDKVKLSGSIDFKRLSGDQPVPPCVTSGADGRLQIKVTARGDARLGGGRAAHAELHGQYTMTAQGKPLAVSGGLSLDADVHVDIVTLKTVDFEFVVGAGDNYVRAEGAGSILIFDVNTRAFFGRTCDPNLVKWIDPQIDALFKKLGRLPVDKDNPLIGYYMMGDGDVLLNRIFDIPDSIVLLKAGGGQGSFIFCDPSLKSIIPGMHTRLSIGVGLGLLSAQAELVALGGLSPIPLTLSSTGLPNVADSFLKDPFNTVKGAVAGRFSPKFSAGPVSWSKDYDFTASGTYIPSPVAPPPGFFLVRQLDF